MEVIYLETRDKSQIHYTLSHLVDVALTGGALILGLLKALESRSKNFIWIQ